MKERASSKAVPRLGGSRHATRRKLTRRKPTRFEPSAEPPAARSGEGPEERVRQWRFRRHLSRHLHPLHSATAIRSRSSSGARAIRRWSPSCVRPRTPRSLLASGPSTTALAAATASSFTCDLRAARCCREGRWEQVEWRPSAQLLDDRALPFGTQSQRRRLHAPSSATAEEPIRYLRSGQARASLEK
jgi:hypothetical protein